MKTKFLLVLLFCCSYCLSSNFVTLNGVINDISKDESNVLYSCKDKVDEAYSSGSLYLYNVLSQKAIKIAKIKFMEYGIKSYFLGRDSILIASNDGIFLYNIKANKIIKSVIDINKIGTLVSTKKTNKDIGISTIDYNMSKLKYYNLRSNNLNLLLLRSSNVSVLPTDNFFDYYYINDKIIQFENGKLFEITDKSKAFNVAFNDTKGEYLIASNKKSICFVENKKNIIQIKFFYSGVYKTIPLTISNKLISQITISPAYSNNDNLYILTVGKDYYTISDKGIYQKTNLRIIYSSKKLVIKLIGNRSFEIS
jgi:hypothetical protein